jgi:hypothetical protein
MKVELLDERFKLLPGFSGVDAGRVAADGGLDCPVAWPRGDLATLAGRTARILVTLDRGADGAGDAAAEPRRRPSKRQHDLADVVALMEEYPELRTPKTLARLRDVRLSLHALDDG